MLLPNIKLPNEVLASIVESGNVYTPYLNGFGIVYKAMSTYDEGLSNYINQVNLLRKRGVQTPAILSSKLIPETTRSYRNDSVHLTKGVYVVEQALGISLEDISDIHLSSKDSIDGVKETENYIETIRSYLEELEKRANAPQEVYDKLVSDILILQKKGMDIDLDSSHFFFDEGNGFTIVDIAPFKLSAQRRLPMILNYAVFGGGVPKLFLDTRDLSFVTPAFYKRLNTCFCKLYCKICSILLKLGIPNEYFDSIFSPNAKMSSLKEVEDIAEIPIQMLQLQAIFIGLAKNSNNNLNLYKKAE